VSDEEGILRMTPQDAGPFASPTAEIDNGEWFRVEVDGAADLKLTRMEFWHFGGPLKRREYREGRGEYYSVEGYELRDGLRAAIGNGRT
jgi:hypothetical protein